MKLILRIARLLEALALRGLPAIVALATAGAYRGMGVGPGGENENAVAFGFVGSAWVVAGPKLFVRVKGILRWRAWLSALAFIVVMQVAGVMFMVIWHPFWAGFWIFLVTFFAMLMILPEEEENAPSPRAPAAAAETARRGK